MVEVDGPAYHFSGRAIRRDREKEATLASHGFELMRVLPDQVDRESEAIVARIAGRLAILARLGRG